MQLTETDGSSVRRQATQTSRSLPIREPAYLYRARRAEVQHGPLCAGRALWTTAFRMTLAARQLRSAVRALAE